MTDIQQLLAAATAASENAYAPYSRLFVGAAVLTGSGDIYSGCNVENVAFPVGGCAEHHAIAAAVRAEGAAMRLRAVAISARAADGGCVAITPCGACRQLILEFGADAEVIFRAQDGEPVRLGIAELLPHSFAFAT